MPFSFKEIDADGLSVYVADPERAARVAGHRGRGTPGCGTSRRADKRIVLMLSAYPTKHSRIGNAVGLDTPASRGRAAQRRCASAGYDVGELPGRRRRGDGDALIHALIAAGGQDPDWLTEEQLAGNPVRISGGALPRAGSPRLPAGPARAASSSTGARRRASSYVGRRRHRARRAARPGTWW